MLFVTYTINGEDYNVEINQWGRTAFVFTLNPYSRGEECSIHYSNTPEAYFLYKGTKVYINDFKKCSFEEFYTQLEKARKHEYESPISITQLFLQMLLTEGVKTLKFSVPLFYDPLLIEVEGYETSKHCHINDTILKINLSEHSWIEFEDDEPEDAVIKQRSFHIDRVVEHLLKGTIDIMKG